MLEYIEPVPTTSPEPSWKTYNMFGIPIMPRLASLFSSRHAIPLAILTLAALIYWAPVLFLGRVLLGGDMLAGFAPFGSNATAPWNILQWDSMAQYYPWRLFAARELQAGHLPLWNPYQFSGVPFIANGQSAVFYPLNIVFWILDPAYAFGVSAFLHSLLASFSAYFLTQRWSFSRAASVLSGIAFAFCGYLASWIMLPTLADTASWLPLCLLLLEKARQGDVETQRQGDTTSPALPFSGSPLLQASHSRSLPLALALTCALLAGHAQIFFYILVALALRALFFMQPVRGRSGFPFIKAVLREAICALSGFACAFIVALMLGALQLLPTLDLARLGHRAGAKPSPEGWAFLQRNAMPWPDLVTCLTMPIQQYSLSENFCYGGIGILLLVAAACFSIKNAPTPVYRRNLLFAFTLAAFGLLYAMATPLSQFFYFVVPGLAQMGGVGRAFLLWSFGAALLAGFGLDALRRRWKTEVIPILFCGLIFAELFNYGMWPAHPTAPRASIYPQTEITTWLQKHSDEKHRVLFLTPRDGWLPTEIKQMNPPYHPPGVLPPNGAMVYGLYDVNGYDSLAPVKYRGFLFSSKGPENWESISPALNGNMILLDYINSSNLIDLGVNFIVTQQAIDDMDWKKAFQAEGCTIYQRIRATAATQGGQNFSPGWQDGKYQPASFRLGLFISLCAWMLVCAVAAYEWNRKKNA